jgi:hypothetical protein
VGVVILLILAWSNKVRKEVLSEEEDGWCWFYWKLLARRGAIMLVSREWDESGNSP